MARDHRLDRPGGLGQAGGMTVRLRFSLLPAAALALLPIACQGADRVPDTISIADATRFLGTPLPDGARDVRVGGQAGLDRLVLLRFETDDAGADAFARAATGAPLVAGRDPGLGYLGASTDWWLRRTPADFAGGQAMRGNRTIKLLATPGEPGRQVVYAAAFEQ